MTASTHSEKTGASLWFEQLGALMVKEFQQIYRDPSSWLVAGVLPFVFLLLFGYGISLDPGVLKIALLNAGGGPDGQKIAASFSHSPWFEALAPESMPQAEILMRNSQAQAILLFRPDYESERAAGRVGKMQLLVDGSEPNTARFMEMYATRLISESQAADNPGGQPARARIEAVNRVWYNADARSEYFLVPGAITVIMTLIGTLLTSLVFAREWERGTIEVLFTTPVSRAQILLGKIIPYFCLGMAAMALCTLVAILLFGIPFRGSFTSLAILASVFLLSALGQGLVISISLKRQLVAAQAGLYSGFLPALLLSGFVFDTESMPLILRGLSRLLPATWFNVCVRTIFLAGDIWAVFWPCLAAMAAIAGMFLTIVYIKLRKRLN